MGFRSSCIINSLLNAQDVGLPLFATTVRHHERNCWSMCARWRYGLLYRYIDQVSSERTVQIRDWTGDRIPLHAVSSGKLFLALAGEKRIEEYLVHSSLTQYTPNTIIDPDHLRERLALIRDQGHDGLLKNSQKVWWSCLDRSTINIVS